MNAQGEESAISETHHPYQTMNDSGVKDASPTLPPPATYATASPLRRSNRCRRRCVLSACCCCFLTLVLIIGIGVLIEWLIIQPKNGNYDLEDARLQTFSLARNGTQQSYELDTDMDLEFLFNNPNHRMGFDIKGFNVHASYAGVEIGQSADVPPFYQGKLNETIRRSEIRAGKTVLAETVGDGLQGEIGSNVSLLVVMNAKVRNDHGILKALHPYHGVHLTCFVILMAPNGSAPGNLISKSCSVKRG